MKKCEITNTSEVYKVTCPEEPPQVPGPLFRYVLPPNLHNDDMGEYGEISDLPVKPWISGEVFMVASTEVNDGSYLFIERGVTNLTSVAEFVSNDSDEEGDWEMSHVYVIVQGARHTFCTFMRITGT